jgi:D-alanyl-D-alanine carboxypeptidase
MITMMLGKDLRKIVGRGDGDETVMDIEIQAIVPDENNKVVRVVVGWGIVEIPYFDMTGDYLSWEDIVTPCIAVIKADDLNHKIFTIRSIKTISGKTPNTTETNPTNPEANTPNADIAPETPAENGEHKCQCGGNCGKGSKTPYQGSAYKPTSDRNW